MAKNSHAVLGCLQATLVLPDSRSLKDKRRIVRSLCDGLRVKFNCATAQIDTDDNWQRARVAVCVVANERRFVDEMLGTLSAKIEDDPRYTVTEIGAEVI